MRALRRDDRESARRGAGHALLPALPAPVIDAFATAFAFVFIAELGDKSMLLALTLGVRYPAWWVLTAHDRGHGRDGALRDRRQHRG
ncbi:MAG: TMEM165/GDT1 family protein [Dehalococcoidia bacterium]|nr:TMEM165/GDT1 family protein [Dehalococcoidia bacterium]